MSEVVQYINDDGVEIIIKKEISDSLPEFYFETYFENGKAMYEKQYENGELNNVSYYAYSHDEIESILKDKKGNVFITFIYYNRSHKITENLAFRENNIISKTIIVQDQNEDLICFKKFELENSELVCTITDKSFYENGVEKFALFIIMMEVVLWLTVLEHIRKISSPEILEHRKQILPGVDLNIIEMLNL